MSEQETLLRAARLLIGQTPAAERLLRETLDWALRARATLMASGALVLETRRRLVVAFLAEAGRAGDGSVAPIDSAADTWTKWRSSGRAGGAAAEPSLTRSTGQMPSLLAGLASLSAEHRAIVVARYYLALSIMEIGEVVDLDDMHVQRTAADVLQALQHKLEDGSWRLTDNWSWFRGQADAELAEAAQPDDRHDKAAANPHAEPDRQRRHLRAAIAATMLTLSLGLIGVAIGLGTTAGDPGPSLPARPVDAELSGEEGLPAPSEPLDIRKTPTTVPSTREKTSSVPVTRYPTPTVGSWPSAPSTLTTAQRSASTSTTATSTPNSLPTRPTGTSTPPPSASPSPSPSRSPSPSTSPSPTDSDDD